MLMQKVLSSKPTQSNGKEILPTRKRKQFQKLTDWSFKIYLKCAHYLHIGVIECPVIGPNRSDGLVESIGHKHVLACHLVVHSGALVPHCDPEGCLHGVIVHVHESLDELDLLFGVDVEVEVVDEVIHISH